MSAAAWRYVTLPWAMPLPCKRCGEQAATVAVYEGRTWQYSMCTACAEAHRAEHEEQLELFGETT